MGGYDSRRRLSLATFARLLTRAVPSSLVPRLISISWRLSATVLLVDVTRIMEALTRRMSFHRIFRRRKKSIKPASIHRARSLVLLRQRLSRTPAVPLAFLYAGAIAEIKLRSGESTTSSISFPLLPVGG